MLPPLITTFGAVSPSPNPFSGSLLVALTATEPARPQSASVAVTVATYTIW